MGIGCPCSSSSSDCVGLGNVNDSAPTDGGELGRSKRTFAAVGAGDRNGLSSSAVGGADGSEQGVVK